MGGAHLKIAANVNNVIMSDRLSIKFLLGD